MGLYVGEGWGYMCRADYNSRPLADQNGFLAAQKQN